MLLTTLIFGKRVPDRNVRAESQSDGQSSIAGDATAEDTKAFRIVLNLFKEASRTLHLIRTPRNSGGFKLPVHLLLDTYHIPSLFQHFDKLAVVFESHYAPPNS